MFTRPFILIFNSELYPIVKMNAFWRFAETLVPYASLAVMAGQAISYLGTDNDDELHKAELENLKTRAELEKREKQHEEELQKAKAEFERQLDEKLQENEKKHKKLLLNQFNKMARETNYARHFPMPQNLIEHHKDHPDAFRIQILGTRGAGKSTFINQLMKLSGL